MSRPSSSRARLRTHPKLFGTLLARYRDRYEHTDDGFTLVELIITTLILPIVIGAIVLMLVSLFANQGTTSNQTFDSADAQAVASFYEQDVQSAVSLTTSASASQCGPGTQLLGLEWNLNSASGTYQTVVSYVEVANATGFELVRNDCTSGASATPTTTTIVSSDAPAGLAPPTVTFVSGSSHSSPSSGWIATTGVTGVTFAITEPLSKYSYALTSVPRDGVSSGDQAQVTNPNTSCGFASPGTGTYAASLCFVDFSSYNYTASPLGCGGNAQATPMSAAITNTPYTLTFCVSQSGTGPVAPWPIPTYTDPPTSEAFLGNNGFYTNIPGDPALYQTTEGTTTTVVFTNIQLLDSNGDKATGWDLATGDAESTDSGESMTWTSDQDLSLLPNTPTSQIGNACASPTLTDPAAIDLTGIGTTSVECAASVDSDKTGTVMLDAPAPTKLTVNLVGTGLEALFLGVLLP